jgi:hypothetical protein
VTLNEYVQLFSKWEAGPSVDLFSRIVAGADVLARSQRELAEQFEVAESTVSRWAKGYARPHPRVQRYVVSTLRKQVLRAMKARTPEALTEEEHAAPAKAVA